MAAGVYDISIDQGDTYTLNGTYYDGNNTVVNLTGYTARLQIRRATDSSSALIDLTESSGITLGGALGTFVCELTKVQTAALPVGYSRYDLELTPPNGKTFKILKGDVMVAAEVTR